jgi:exosortase/archaeosortase family protein
MIGLLFGELKRLQLVRRILLVIGAIAIALCANCLRALFLVWLATSQQAGSVTRWHDIAGYSIVLVVFVGTMILAAWLAKGPVQRQKKEDQAQPRLIHSLMPVSSLFIALAWLFCVEIAVEFWYRSHERHLIAEKNWSVQWPADAAGFRETPIDEGVRRTLRFDEGHQASWMVSAQPGKTEGESISRAFAFFFRWNARGSSVVRARAHRPDICLPSVGWSLTADEGTHNYEVGNLSVPFRRNVFRKEGTNAVAYTYFCLQEDQRRPDEDRPDLRVTGGAQPDWSSAERTRVVRNGVRNLGQRVLEIILVSPAPLDRATVEEEFARTLQALVRPESDHS